jgi:hypothetical protein
MAQHQPGSASVLTQHQPSSDSVLTQHSLGADSAAAQNSSWTQEQASPTDWLITASSCCTMVRKEGRFWGSASQHSRARSL